MRDPGDTNSTPTGDDEPALTGGDLLIEEAREEAARLVAHPVEEIKRLEHVAAEGESPATMLIVAVGVTLFIMVVLAIVMTVIMVVYYKT